MTEWAAEHRQTGINRCHGCFHTLEWCRCAADELSQVPHDLAVEVEKADRAVVDAFFAPPEPYPDALAAAEAYADRLEAGPDGFVTAEALQRAFEEAPGPVKDHMLRILRGWSR